LEFEREFSDLLLFARRNLDTTDTGGRKCKKEFRVTLSNLVMAMPARKRMALAVLLRWMGNQMSFGSGFQSDTRRCVAVQWPWLNEGRAAAAVAGTWRAKHWVVRGVPGYLIFKIVRHDWLRFQVLGCCDGKLYFLPHDVSPDVHFSRALLP
jgi:hypothetical protein